MPNLLNRIRRIEAEHTPVRGCTVCGAGDGDPASKRVFTVAFEGDGDDEDTPEHCPGCGRRQVFTIEFDRRG